MTEPPKEPEFSKIMDMWVAGDLKVQALVFFHDNPGVIETMQGLAKRLGATVETLQRDLGGHLALGLIQEKQVGGMSLLVFDRKREGEVQKLIEEYFKTLRKTKAAS